MAQASADSYRSKIIEGPAKMLFVTAVVQNTLYAIRRTSHRKKSLDTFSPLWSLSTGRYIENFLSSATNA